MKRTHHVFKARWTELGHHRLRERKVRCLEEAKYNIVCPSKNIIICQEKYVFTNQNSQTLWNLTCSLEMVIETG